MKMIYRYLMVITLSYLLTACGFHLQGSMQKLPPQLHTLYLDFNAPYSSFSKQLKNVLSQQKITLVDTPDQAPSILRILGTSQTNHTVGNVIANTSQSNAYDLTYSARFSLLLSNGTVIIPTQTVSASDVISLPANTLVSSSDTAQNTYNSLQTLVIQKIMTQLSSPQTIEKLAQVEKTAANNSTSSSTTTATDSSSNAPTATQTNENQQ